MLRSKSTLRIVASNYWGKLTPQQQSTSMADTLLGNAFEPLVDLSMSGGVAPGLAESWTVNDESTEFVFTLRPNAKFSDGTPVTAHDFVRSWLASVTTREIDGEKPNTLDVLYKLQGFSTEAAEAKAVPGLEALDDRTLRLEFANPFRTALFELTGTRYAAWKKQDDGSVIGSGAYLIIEHIPGKLVRYQPNPHSPKPAMYEEVQVHGYEDAWEEMKKGEAAVMLGVLPIQNRGSDFDCLGGSVSAHMVIDVNGTPGGIFSDPVMRKAFLYAIHGPVAERLRKKIPLLKELYDPQFFQKFWDGRLPENEVSRLILSGQDHFVSLIKASRKKPIRFVYSPGFGELIESELEELGIVFAKPKRPVDTKTRIETVYAKHDFDITYGGASVVGNDPDGIYHLLGTHGAIGTKQIFRPKTAKLLDAGRELKRSDDLNSHYQEVGRAILEEVPVVHVTFEPPYAYYNRKLSRKATSSLNSDRFSFNSIEQL